MREYRYGLFKRVVFPLLETSSRVSPTVLEEWEVRGAGFWVVLCLLLRYPKVHFCDIQLDRFFWCLIRFGDGLMQCHMRAAVPSTGILRRSVPRHTPTSVHSTILSRLLELIKGSGPRV